MTEFTSISYAELQVLNQNGRRAIVTDIEDRESDDRRFTGYTIADTSAQARVALDEMPSEDALARAGYQAAASLAQWPQWSDPDQPPGQGHEFCREMAGIMRAKPDMALAAAFDFWLGRKGDKGWTAGPWDHGARTHPLIKEWAELSDADRATIEAIYNAVVSVKLRNIP